MLAASIPGQNDVQVLLPICISLFFFAEFSKLSDVVVSAVAQGYPRTRRERDRHERSELIDKTMQCKNTDDDGICARERVCVSACVKNMQAFFAILAIYKLVLSICLLRRRR